MGILGLYCQGCVWTPYAPYKVSLSSLKPADQPGHLAIRGGLPLIKASFLTRAHQITALTRPITV